MTKQRDLKNRIRARQQKTGESYTTAHAHVLRAQQQLTGGTKQVRLRAVVLRCMTQALRLRLDGEEHEVTLRTSDHDAWTTAPGQFIEVLVKRRWVHGGHPYMSGCIERTWTDVPALGLEPLAMVDHGIDDLTRCEPFVPPDPYAPMWELFVATPRRAFVMDELAWDIDADLDEFVDEGGYTCNAAGLRQMGDDAGARELVMEALHIDLRCIDAHVHLGNWEFDKSPRQALRHYKIAVAIGELSLGSNFENCLPWGHIYNRPFLRALHGLGLCRWRLGEPDRALEIFTRMLKLNPRDNQGVRVCWTEVRTGQTWSESAEHY